MTYPYPQVQCTMSWNHVPMWHLHAKDSSAVLAAVLQVSIVQAESNEKIAHKNEKNENKHHSNPSGRGFLSSQHHIIVSRWEWGSLPFPRNILLQKDLRNSPSFSDTQNWNMVVFVKYTLSTSSCTDPDQHAWAMSREIFGYNRFPSPACSYVLWAFDFSSLIWSTLHRFLWHDRYTFCLESWTSTTYFSNSTGSFVASGWHLDNMSPAEMLISLNTRYGDHAVMWLHFLCGLVWR